MLRKEDMVFIGVLPFACSVCKATGIAVHSYHPGGGDSTHLLLQCAECKCVDIFRHEIEVSYLKKEVER